MGRARRRGLRPRYRQGRGLHGHLRTGRDQSGDGLANAMLDSVPVVAITGQVVQPLIGRDAFQEVRHHRHHPAGHQAQLPGQRIRGHRADDQGGVLPGAIGRPGPVLVDIPKNLFIAKEARNSRPR